MMMSVRKRPLFRYGSTVSCNTWFVDVIQTRATREAKPKPAMILLGRGGNLTQNDAHSHEAATRNNKTNIRVWIKAARMPQHAEMENMAQRVRGGELEASMAKHRTPSNTRMLVMAGYLPQSSAWAGMDQPHPARAAAKKAGWFIFVC